MDMSHEAALPNAPPVVAAPDAPAPVYTCPMHPEVMSKEPGHCPKCHMTLILKKPAEAKP
jgi:hypothetical protein